MPIKYPRGSYIVRDGERRKVLEELGELRFLSWDRQENLDWETMASMTQKTAIELERDGWKVEEDAKAPEPRKPGMGQASKCPHSGELFPGAMVVHCAECGGLKVVVTSPAWKPKDGEVVFYVTEIGNADGFKFCSKDGFGVEYLQVGNLYPTREEAEKAAERVRKAYRG